MVRDRIAFGLKVRSTLEIPGSLAATAGGDPDLFVTDRPERARHDSPARLGPYSFADGTLIFQAPGIAEYSISDNAIAVAASPEATAEEVSALLVATALPAALWLRGDLMLHAAAAVLPGYSAALAFAGGSGAGKSRLLASLVAAGSQVVAEDSVCLRHGPAGTTLSGLPGCLFLREADAPLAQVRRRVEVPSAQRLAGARAAALIVLDGHADALPVRLHGAEAVVGVLDSLHRPRVARLLGLLPGLLPRVAELLGETPVYRWRPRFDANALRTLVRLAGESEAG